MAEQSVTRTRKGSVVVSRRLTATGCLPLAVGLALALLLFLNVVTFVKAPSWINDVREWRTGGRLLVSFAVLAALQLIGTWVLGLMGAIGGAQAYEAGGDEGPSRRLLVGPALGVVALRVLLVGLAALAIGLVVSGFFNPSIEGWAASRLLALARHYLLLIIIGVAPIGLHLLAGPFLRARYSLALGMWAASWPDREADRPWIAASARLGAGFVGLFGLMWGTTLLTLGWLNLTDPILDRQGIAIPRLLANVPDPLAAAIGGLIAAAVISGLVTVGQVCLPWVYRALARRRIQA